MPRRCTLAHASVVQGDEAAVYADRAYDSAANREAPAAVGIRTRIMHRARRNHPIGVWQARHNRMLAPIQTPGRRDRNDHRSRKPDRTITATTMTTLRSGLS